MQQYKFLCIIKMARGGNKQVCKRTEGFLAADLITLIQSAKIKPRKGVLNYGLSVSKATLWDVFFSF